MPRRLKTFVTTSGFFELAVAAPTMKAALELWGAGPDLFQRGYARETTDAAIAQAALAKPGVVLRRGVGTTGAFTEHAELPDLSTLDRGAKKKPAAEPSPSPETKPKISSAVQQKAAQLYEQAQKQRDRAMALAEAKEQRRAQEIKKAEDAIAAAQAEHDKRITAIERKIADYEGKARAEDERWKAERERLAKGLRKARG